MDGSDIGALSDVRIGRIIAVSASQAVALLERCDPSRASERDWPVEMGALVKMQTRVSTVYGMVSGLRVPLPNLSPSDQELKVIELELAGETLREENGDQGAFRRGVSAHPALDEPVYLASPADLAQVYARPSVATARIGTLHQDSAVPAYILTNELFGKHFSIVGTTGSGKSCVVATILSAVIERNPNAHVMLIDPHGEYAAAFGDQGLVLSPGDGLHLPYWLFNFEEIVEIVLGSDRQPEQAKILGDAILAAKQAYFAKQGLDKTGTVDTPVPYRMSEVLRHLDVAMGALDRPENVGAFQGLQQRLQTLQSDARYAFVFGQRLTVRDELTAIIAQLLRIPVDGKPITILDVSGIPSEVLNVVVSVLCRLTFDFALWSDSPVPVTIVCEEAHRYAPRDTGLGFEPAKRALSRIAKEGRKYGVFLGLVTQRPAELDATIISQCNTLFAMRLANDRDQALLRSAVSDAAANLLSFVPSLGTREVLAFGEGVALPTRLRFKEVPVHQLPRSEATIASVPSVSAGHAAARPGRTAGTEVRSVSI